jgi:hypothetical protein
METRELILLSPYQIPAQNPLMICAEDTAAWLNGFSALWHPAALQGAAGPPRFESPYEHEQPRAGCIYALPASPPLILPEDWEERASAAPATFFKSTADRAATFANLNSALRADASAGNALGLLELEPARVRPFLAIGFGHGMLAALFEAMEHESVLAGTDFWIDIQEAIAALPGPDAEGFRSKLQAAARRLQEAREVIYPAKIYLVDLCLLDDQRPGASLPLALEMGSPTNCVAAGSDLELMARNEPDKLAVLKARVEDDTADVCGGPYLEREETLLPLESQLWNLLKGQEIARSLLGRELQVFARKRFGHHPHLPLLLQSAGLTRAVLLSFDEAVIPTHRSTVINWPSPDGKQVEAFTRAPYAADNPQTFFHWAHYLRRTIAEDHSATITLLHRGLARAAPSYEDLLELSLLEPVFGEWVTLSRYLNDVLAGEYASAAAADDFHGDYLGLRHEQKLNRPVSWFAEQVRGRRHLDMAWTLAALCRGLMGPNDTLRLEAQLAELEEKLELGGDPQTAGLDEVQNAAAGALADRLLARATATTPGTMLINPCSFTRRAALELPGFAGNLTVAGPIKAFQLDTDKARLVVEVPALGFAWIPAHGNTGSPAAAARMRLADARHVRNEFFEAEIDLNTGGLRAVRDHRTRINRIGQQLVFNPGSQMRAREVKVTAAGAALGEIVSEGDILGEKDEVLATYRQTFRAWLGRPILELRVEVHPRQLPQGFPWHAFYGARFAWRDERALLLRGVNGTGFLTTYTHPETPDYLEIREGRASTVIFPGGLPFHQRHGSRMLDVILIPENETCRTFDLGIGLDRDYPMQTALGMVTGIAAVPVSNGPPHVGASGWLFHLDSPNLLLTSLRPGPAGADAVLARLIECQGHAGQAELRCPRNPRRAGLTETPGSMPSESTTTGDTVVFDVPRSGLVQLRVDFDS